MVCPKCKIDITAVYVISEATATQIGQLAVELDWLKKKTGHLS